MTNVSRFNNQTLPEEIANAISHGLGAAFAIAGTVLLILKSMGSVAGVVAASIYSGSLIILYLMSTLYHSFTHYKTKRVFQVLDHCSIFLLILGSYAPFCLVVLNSLTGYILLGFNLALTILGIVLNSVSLAKWHKFSLVLYLLMGWSVVIDIKPLLAHLTTPGVILLAIGGLFYSIGVFFYRAKRPRFMHMVWHLFVIFGSICHYICIYYFVYI